MKFLDVLLGRTKPVRPDLDALFAVPAAATGLEAALGIRPTGAGAVCFRTAEGEPGARAEKDALELATMDATSTVEVSRDEYAYSWVTIRRADRDLAALVTGLHAVNTALGDAGFGSGLLCIVLGFTTADGRPVGLVYVFKRGTFYPFAPVEHDRRDNELELAIRAHLGTDLPVEPDLARWFPLWSAPPLR